MLDTPFCERCGLHFDQHRQPRTARSYDAERESRRERKPQAYRKRERASKRVDRIVGVDGEGQGRGPHRYLYLAGADEHEESFDVSAPHLGQALSTEACLDFFLALPPKVLVVGYAFLYDLTKILTDLPDRTLYRLFHEEARQTLENGRVVYSPVEWAPREDAEPYFLNFMNRRFTVQRGRRVSGQGRVSYSAGATVWDVFRFFQGKFTTALKEWKVGAPNGWDWNDKKAPGWEPAFKVNVPPLLKWLETMKDQRSDFEKLSWADVQRYCRLECTLLAQLVRAVVDAHLDAGLDLKSYYGVGSTASALLGKMGTAERKGEPPEAARAALAAAFFGGRFEVSRLGLVPGPVRSYDISSAYPYQLSQMPCLACGRWELTMEAGKVERAVASATLACVRWTIPPKPAALHGLPWGTLPVRAEDGTITFPLAAAGGWAWREEFYAARRLDATVTAREVWAYRTECRHRPFGDLPFYYNERCRIGKDGAGKVFKLGPNAAYGKVAQSRGHNPPFQSWAWAGNTTSGTRAQLLGALLAAREAHGDESCVVMFATDSVASTLPLEFPTPVDTGTAATGKPLGGWEAKTYERGLFLVRPGIYFPPDPTAEEVQEVRARGLGRKVLYESATLVQDAFAAGADRVEVPGVQRFVGVKTGLSFGPKSGVKRSPAYGEWAEWPIVVGFHPAPKREFRREDDTLSCWAYAPEESVPYAAALESSEAKLAKLMEQIAEEQPDTDFMT